jgi:uncharacterized protein YbdZ (MbtH family)
MTNPFENEEADYLVLRNDEGQCSLWPSLREIPVGWTAVGPKGRRCDCMAWTDMQDLAWSVVALGGVEVHYVPGIHDTIFEDGNVQYLAAKVDDCIRSVLSKSK